MSTQLSIDGLTCRFGRVTAVNDVSLQTGSGILGIVGRNGAGKTTLLRILATVLLPTGGDATFAGHSVVSEPHAIRSRLGYLPQEVGFYPRLTVRETLRLFAASKSGGVHARSAEVNRVLEAVNLQAEAKKRVRELSGGMRRRLGIAQALLGNPDLLILDEPTYGLDPWERAGFHATLSELAASRTIVFSTHIVSDIERLATSVAVMDAGRLQYFGPVDDLRKRAVGQVWVTDDPSVTDTGELIGASTVGGALHYRMLAPAAAGASPVDPTLEDAVLLITAAPRPSAR